MIKNNKNIKKTNTIIAEVIYQVINHQITFGMKLLTTFLFNHKTMTKKFYLNTLSTRATQWVIFIRLSLAMVFIPEGIQKLIFPEILGSGRFTAIGIPYPELMGPFVGYVELICGLMLLFGFAVRWAAIPLIVTMLVAIISTKIPILLGQDWWIFQVASFKRYGLWSMLHETRTDWAMLMCSLYIIFVGAGRWSVDRLIFEKSQNNHHEN